MENTAMPHTYAVLVHADESLPNNAADVSARADTVVSVDGCEDGRDDSKSSKNDVCGPERQKKNREYCYI